MQLCVLIMNLLISNLNLTNPMLHQLNLIFFVIILKMVCLNLANASGVLVTPNFWFYQTEVPMIIKFKVYSQSHQLFKIHQNIILLNMFMIN
jgi:hypothetical protein